MDTRRLTLLSSWLPCCWQPPCRRLPTAATIHAGAPASASIGALRPWVAPPPYYYYPPSVYYRRGHRCRAAAAAAGGDIEQARLMPATTGTTASRLAPITRRFSNARLAGSACRHADAWNFRP